MVILVLYSWNKIYYIIRKKGNDPNNYFYSLKINKCCIHNSYTCDCNKTDCEKEIIDKYINLYKYCSNIIIYSNGKLRFIKKQSKNQLIFTI